MPTGPCDSSPRVTLTSPSLISSIGYSLICSRFAAFRRPQEPLSGWALRLAIPLRRGTLAGGGSAGGDRRRVAGRRREELALLAGVGPSYYARLEQGESRHASPQVIEAIATA